jgi:methionyl-tRNA formyltransferase
MGEDRIKVLNAEVLPLSSPLPPGTRLDDGLTIACGEGALRILRLQKVGRSCLSAEEFLRGYDLPPILVSNATL